MTGILQKKACSINFILPRSSDIADSGTGSKLSLKAPAIHDESMLSSIWCSENDLARVFASSARGFLTRRSKGRKIAHLISFFNT